jgi:L-alanine-DL-glutamate epimerase-like enolase superfamily enzyme
LPVVDGLILLSDSPGLGIELNRETIDKFRVN